MAKKIKLSPVHLQYWCKTSVIDEIVCQRRGIQFDHRLAEAMEKKARHYFVVDTKGNFEVVNGPDFEKYFNDKNVEMKDWKPAPHMDLPEGAKQYVDKFILETHGV